MSTKGFGRVDRDAWFTPRETSEKIVDYLLEEYPGWRGLEWVEPSAGDGSFIDACEARGVSVTGYDLEPKMEDIIQADFLGFGGSELDLSGKILIGNPPYGVRNKLTIEFINKAFGLGAEKVAFLVMSGLMNASFLKRVRRRVDLIKFVETDFVVGENRKSIDMNLMVIVFDKEEDDRDWNELINGPYCRGIRHGEVIEDKYIIAGFNKLDNVENIMGKIEIYKLRDSFTYKVNNKLYCIYHFYNKDIFISGNMFLRDLFKKINNIGKITSSTVNYWLIPENRVKVDWEVL